MPPKRKLDVIAALDTVTGDDAEELAEGSSAKKARIPQSGDASFASTSGPKDKKAKDTETESGPKRWYEVKLEGEDEGEVPIYDDCKDIRRKIRALPQEPGFKVTPWLEQIGKVNSNSYQRFMKASGPTGGATNGTYCCAYVYFEKRRIAEGKKKTAKRLKAEEEQAGGRPLEDRRRTWVFGPAKGKY